ncbi:cold-shock protein [Natronococcus pandeyae]|uniref:Cold-shock protein n=1 Tax=Natronococcus pandeyae TaxID=2055836 RepID=A0A8J8PYQ0_9EURY|nr:cold shock domain-containing protein [Natronococcus pandeyae]TYL35847.1 cold-shock protein [Natronococcus pandeyae]
MQNYNKITKTDIEGKITTYNAERGFGFARVAGISKDDIFTTVFVHINDVPAREVLEPGDKVRMDVYLSPKGWKADGHVETM